MTADDLPAVFATFPPSWSEALADWTPELQASVVASVRRVSADRAIAPLDPFRALRLVEPDAVKVVVLGQDPYPTEGHADGLAFSCAKGTPRSLARIFEVLAQDRPAFDKPPTGSLEAWARQGVLLLNPVLTVEIGRTGSHERCGWQALTGRIVAALCRRVCPPVFLLWGDRARAFFERALPSGARAHSGRHTGPRTGAEVEVLVTRHPSYDFRREFMASSGSHFVATQDLVDWWGFGRVEPPVV